MRAGRPGQPLHDDLEEIRKAAQRSADLTRQLLAFARKQTVAPKVLDLNETVEGMLKMLRRLIGEDIDLAWLPGADLWPVKMDPAQIDQILANLCVNARDAIAGVGKVTIETENVSLRRGLLRRARGLCPRRVCAAGRQRRRLRHGQGDARRTSSSRSSPPRRWARAPAWGWPRSTASSSRTMASSTSTASRARGRPSRSTCPGTRPERRAAAAGSAAELPQGRGETVLLVEDEPAILDMGKVMLEQLGYTVLAAGTPGEAIRLAEEHAGEIHLLMTDVVMPEMNGRDLAERLLSLYPDLKCLFMSGYTANVIAHHGVLDEGVHFIQKPFSMQDLAAKVREVLDNK